MSLNRLTAHEFSDTITRGEVTWGHILWDALRGIEEGEEKVDSFIFVFRERAFQRAR